MSKTTDITELLKDITPEQLYKLAAELDIVASRPTKIDTSYARYINHITSTYFNATKYMRPCFMTQEAYNNEVLCVLEQIRGDML